MTGDGIRPVGRPIVLVGFMAAGKSTVGRLLAQRLNCPFVDVDEEIEASSGMEVAEIFRVNGERHFRDAERTTISRLLNDGAQVIAIGGGAFDDGGTREALNARGRTIWLDPAFDVIRSRLGRSTGRPLAWGRSESELLALWRDRRKFYAQAQIRIVPNADDPVAVVDQIIAEVGHH